MANLKRGLKRRRARGMPRPGTPKGERSYVRHGEAGNALLARGDPKGAITCFEKALYLRPDSHEAHFALGVAHGERGDKIRAVHHYEHALAARPNDPETLGNLGATLHLLGQTDDSIRILQRAVHHAPNARNHNNLGTALKAARMVEEAVRHYTAAIAADQLFWPAYKNLGAALHELGEIDASITVYRQALDIKPDDGVRMRLATTYPILASSHEDIVRTQRQHEQEVEALLESSLNIGDPLSEIGTTGVYPPYHGTDVRIAQERLSQLHRHACPSLGYTAPHCSDIHSLPEKIHIGFISRFFFEHPMCKFNRGFIREISRDVFDVTVFTFEGQHRDDVTRDVEQSADRTVILPMDLEQARLLIAQERLHVLYFADIGMEPMTYFLGHARLAPLQVVFPGDPMTSGISTIDAFISSALMETDDAQAHYSEELVCLPSLPAYFDPPPPPDRVMERQDMGVGEGANLYACPHSLFKMHPDYLPVLAEILRRDKDGILFVPASTREHRTKKFAQIVVDVMPDVASRVRFLPRMPLETFLAFLKACDVHLDPVHFGGGTTVFEGLSVGTPVVTWPSEYLRGRVALGCYRHMGMDECITQTLDDYVELAVTLGTDRNRNEQVRQRILATVHRLYHDNTAVRALQTALQQLLETRVSAAAKTVRDTYMDNMTLGGHDDPRTSP